MDQSAKIQYNKKQLYEKNRVRIQFKINDNCMKSSNQLKK